MNFTRTGIILFTEHYRQCVDFYSRIIELPILHSLDNNDSKLTCFNLGEGHYLMVETGGNAIPTGKTIEDNPVWLRFNVTDIYAAIDDLKGKGISVNLRKEVWGTVADFLDPDGNVCSFRDESTF